MNPSHLRFAALLTIALGIVLPVGANVPDESARDFLRKEAIAEKKTLSEFMGRLVMAYDLSARAEAATKEIAADVGFLSVLRKKGIDPDNPTLAQEEKLSDYMLEYWRATGKLPAETTAWFGLMASDLASPWRSAMPHYRALAKQRPDDFPPMLLMLFHPVTTRTDCEEWLVMLKKAHKSAVNEEERAACFMVAGNGTMSMGTNEFARKTLDELARWLGELRKSESSPSALKKLNSLQLALAIVRGKHAEAANFARDTPFRSWRPVWYLMDKQPERAREALGELKLLNDLSEDEKKTITAAGQALEKLAGPKPPPSEK